MDFLQTNIIYVKKTKKVCTGPFIIHKVRLGGIKPRKCAIVMYEPAYGSSFFLSKISDCALLLILECRVFCIAAFQRFTSSLCKPWNPKSLRPYSPCDVLQQSSWVFLHHSSPWWGQWDFGGIHQKRVIISPSTCSSIGVRPQYPHSRASLGPFGCQSPPCRPRIWFDNCW